MKHKPIGNKVSGARVFTKGLVFTWAYFPPAVSKGCQGSEPCAVVPWCWWQLWRQDSAFRADHCPEAPGRWPSKISRHFSRSVPVWVWIPPFWSTEKWDFCYSVLCRGLEHWRSLSLPWTNDTKSKHLKRGGRRGLIDLISVCTACTHWELFAMVWKIHLIIKYRNN